MINIFKLITSNFERFLKTVPWNEISRLGREKGLLSPGTTLLSGVVMIIYFSPTNNISGCITHSQTVNSIFLKCLLV